MSGDNPVAWVDVYLKLTRATSVAETITGSRPQGLPAKLFGAGPITSSVLPGRHKVAAPNGLPYTLSASTPDIHEITHTLIPRSVAERYNGDAVRLLDVLFFELLGARPRTRQRSPTRPFEVPSSIIRATGQATRPIPLKHRVAKPVNIGVTVSAQLPDVHEVTRPLPARGMSVSYAADPAVAIDVIPFSLIVAKGCAKGATPTRPKITFATNFTASALTPSIRPTVVRNATPGSIGLTTAGSIPSVHEITRPLAPVGLAETYSAAIIHTSVSVTFSLITTAGRSAVVVPKRDLSAYAVRFDAASRSTDISPASHRTTSPSKLHYTVVPDIPDVHGKRKPIAPRGLVAPYSADPVTLNDQRKITPTVTDYVVSAVVPVVHEITRPIPPKGVVVTYSSDGPLLTDILSGRLVSAFASARSVRPTHTYDRTAEIITAGCIAQQPTPQAHRVASPSDTRYLVSAQVPKVNPKLCPITPSDVPLDYSAETVVPVCLHWPRPSPVTYTAEAQVPHTHELTRVLSPREVIRRYVAARTDTTPGLAFGLVLVNGDIDGIKPTRPGIVTPTRFDAAGNVSAIHPSAITSCRPVLLDYRVSAQVPRVHDHRRPVFPVGVRSSYTAATTESIPGIGATLAIASTRATGIAPALVQEGYASLIHGINVSLSIRPFGRRLASPQPIGYAVSTQRPDPHARVSKVDPAILSAPYSGSVVTLDEMSDFGLMLAHATGGELNPGRAHPTYAIIFEGQNEPSDIQPLGHRKATPGGIAYSLSADIPDVHAKTQTVTPAVVGTAYFAASVDTDTMARFGLILAHPKTDQVTPGRVHDAYGETFRGLSNPSDILPVGHRKATPGRVTYSLSADIPDVHANIQMIDPSSALTRYSIRPVNLSIMSDFALMLVEGQGDVITPLRSSTVDVILFVCASESSDIAPRGHRVTSQGEIGYTITAQVPHIDIDVRPIPPLSIDVRYSAPSITPVQIHPAVTNAINYSLSADVPDVHVRVIEASPEDVTSRYTAPVVVIHDVIASELIRARTACELPTPAKVMLLGGDLIICESVVPAITPTGKRKVVSDPLDYILAAQRPDVHGLIKAIAPLDIEVFFRTSPVFVSEMSDFGCVVAAGVCADIRPNRSRIAYTARYDVENVSPKIKPTAHRIVTADSVRYALKAQLPDVHSLTKVILPTGELVMFEGSAVDLSTMSDFAVVTAKCLCGSVRPAHMRVVYSTRFDADSSTSAVIPVGHRKVRALPVSYTLLAQVPDPHVITRTISPVTVDGRFSAPVITSSLMSDFSLVMAVADAECVSPARTRYAEFIVFEAVGETPPVSPRSHRLVKTAALDYSVVAQVPQLHGMTVTARPDMLPTDYVAAQVAINEVLQLNLMGANPTADRIAPRRQVEAHGIIFDAAGQGSLISPRGHRAVKPDAIGYGVTAQKPNVHEQTKPVGPVGIVATYTADPAMTSDVLQSNLITATSDADAISPSRSKDVFSILLSASSRCTDIAPRGVRVVSPGALCYEVVASVPHVQFHAVSPVDDIARYSVPRVPLGEVIFSSPSLIESGYSAASVVISQPGNCHLKNVQIRISARRVTINMDGSITPAVVLGRYSAAKISFSPLEHPVTPTDTICYYIADEIKIDDGAQKHQVSPTEHVERYSAAKVGIIGIGSVVPNRISYTLSPDVPDVHRYVIRAYYGPILALQSPHRILELDRERTIIELMKTEDHLS